MRSDRICLIIISLAGASCSDYVYYQGEAQGTSFQVKYMSREGVEFGDEIDSILNLADDHFSTYVSNSLISQFNASPRGTRVDSLFIDLWEKCWELYIESDGYFDPTLYPVSKAYAEMKDRLDTGLLRQSLSNTGMPLVVLRGDSLLKKKAGVSLDLNAVAQGYTVDLISGFLEERKVKHYMVEIGGEVRARGKNEEGRAWTIGIEKPMPARMAIISRLKLDGLSCATSGNYRKFREIGGEKYGHIINPMTGLPVETNVLSISVLSEDCYRADALATALMNRSGEEIKEIDNGHGDFMVFLVESVNGDTVVYMSPDLGKLAL